MSVTSSSHYDVPKFWHHIRHTKMSRRNAIDNNCQSVEEISHTTPSIMKMQRRGAIYRYNPISDLSLVFNNHQNFLFDYNQHYTTEDTEDEDKNIEKETTILYDAPTKFMSQRGMKTLRRNAMNNSGKNLLKNLH